MILWEKTCNMSTQRSEDPCEKAEAFMFELLVGQLTSLCCMGEDGDAQTSALEFFATLIVPQTHG